jgi:hypothetical protein
MPNGKTPKELGYETEDLQWPIVLWSLGIVTVSTLVIIGITVVAFSFRNAPELLMRDVAPVATAEVRPIPEGPLLQPSPPVDQEAYEAESSAHMESFGWVDEANGIVHVPIDHAMEIALHDGFPTGTAPADNAEPSGEEAH